MTFLESKIQSKLLTGTIVFSALLLTGCNQSAGDDPVMPLATVTAKNMKSAVIVPLTYSTKLSDEQKTCLKDIDEKVFAVKADEYYKQNFDSKELQELNDFYASKTGKVFADYGLQQILKATGSPVDETVKEPTKAQIEQIKNLRERPVFKKYEQLNIAVGDDSLMNSLNVSINAELKRCKVDLAI